MYVFLYSDYGFFDHADIGHKDLLDMFKLVTETWGQPAVVVDYDDLTANPGKI